MALEDTLASWTGPSSQTEQEKQERTERMIREAIDDHRAFDNCVFKPRVYAKGSYPNNTNVRTDSDVDVAVECLDAVFWEEEVPGIHRPSTTYTGPWNPAKLRTEVQKALQNKFPGQVDTSGNTAVKVRSSTARVDADVSPCFPYEYHLAGGSKRDGIRIHRKDGRHLENFPAQHLNNGKDKNTRTSLRYKAAVRILKRVNNATVIESRREVPSFLVECLVYNCPDTLFSRPTWTDRVREILVATWQGMQGDAEPPASERWLEVNECKYLFGSHQGWSRRDARDFAKAAWNYLGYS